MAESSITSTCALPPNHHLALWRSLVNRSITAWDELAKDGRQIATNFPTVLLQEFSSLDDFMADGGSSLTFWIFQSRGAFMAQKTMQKWSRDRLDDYIILPASSGFVMRSDCFFVSHFWNSPDHPDPDGTYLRLHQNDLKSQIWLYIWVD